MLKKVDKGIWFNTDSGHYELRFTYKDLKTGKKTRPHIVAQIKLEDGSIRHAINKDEARLAKNQYIANGGAIDTVILKENTALLSDCLKEYILYCNTLNKQRTDLIESYCNYFIQFLADYYYKGNLLKAKNLITVGDIQTIDFYHYINKRQKDKITYKTKDGEKWTGRYVSNATIKRELNSIKGFFRYLKRIAKVIKDNPCEDLDPIRIEEKVKQPPTEAQEAIILQLALEDFNFFVMIVMFNTLGVRKGEVFNLKWYYVHLDSSNIFPFGYIDFVKRKNNKILRIPLSVELQQLLKRIPRESEYVFTNPKTGTKYNSRYRKLNRILEQAGLKDFGIGFHIFRHNTAANLEQSGVESSVISEILGNTAGVVRNTYLNQGAKRKQEVINLSSMRIRKYVKNIENVKNVQKTSKTYCVGENLKLVKS